MSIRNVFIVCDNAPRVGRSGRGGGSRQVAYEKYLNGEYFGAYNDKWFDAPTAPDSPETLRIIVKSGKIYKNTL